MLQRVVARCAPLRMMIAHRMLGAGAVPNVEREQLHDHPALRSFKGAEPNVAASAWVDETCDVIGNVHIDAFASVDSHAVLRGDVNSISVGNSAHIGRHTVVHVARKCRVGKGCVVLDGCVLGSHAVLLPGAVLAPGTQVLSGEVYAGVPAKKVGAVSRKDVAALRADIGAARQFFGERRQEREKQERLRKERDLFAQVDEHEQGRSRF
ncbi:MAG: hypothetical protein MHM6MM_000872 [Cercozoa sp. M6MM]